MLRFFSKNNSDITHLIHNSKTQEVIAALAQVVAAPLESLLDRDADANHFSACLSADIQKSVDRLSICQKIVDDEDFIIRPQKLFGKRDRIVDSVCKRVHD